MRRNALKASIRGISAAVPTPFDSDYELDLGTTAALTEWWVEQGLVEGTAMIKVCSAWGQGPDLLDEEWPRLLKTVVNAGGPDANVMCGIKAKDTLHTIEDAKRAQGLGAKHLQIELPYNHAQPTQDQYVKHFTMISDAIDIGIMIYNTHWFGCDPINAASMLRLDDAEHVAAIKWNTPNDYDEMKAFAHLFNVIDNAGQTVRCHRNGGRGFVSATAGACPAHDIEVWHLLEAGQYDEAQAERDRVSAALAPVREQVAANGGGYRLVKGMMEVIGRPAGPPRLPTEPLNDAEKAQLRAAMEQIGWV